MAVQGPFKVDFDAVFPCGIGAVSPVTARNEFGAGTKENPVQERDKITGDLVWQVDIMNFDPEARERTFKVKIVAAQQPVLPDPMPGVPVRPVVLEGLTVTPYIKEGKFPKIAYSLRATGLAAPKRSDASKAA